MVFLFLALPAGAEEADEGQDHPLFPHLPNYQILDIERDETKVNFPVDAETEVSVPGSRTVITYAFDSETARPTSEPRIARAHMAIIKRLGGEVVFEDKDHDNLTTLKARVDDKEMWVLVEPGNDGEMYTLTIVERPVPGPEIDPAVAELRSALTKQGRVSLDFSFDTGQAVLKPIARPLIRRIVVLMQAEKALRLRIEGHTDDTGPSASRRALSEARALAVKKALVAAGIPASRLSTVGLGDEEPVASNHTPEGRAQNRRIVLSIIPSEKR